MQAAERHLHNNETNQVFDVIKTLVGVRISCTEWLPHDLDIPKIVWDAIVASPAAGRECDMHQMLWLWSGGHDYMVIIKEHVGAHEHWMKTIVRIPKKVWEKVLDPKQ